VKPPDGALVIQAASRTVFPGLIDTHVHFRDYVAELFLAHGVTTVRDAGNPPEWTLALQKLEAAGDRRLPRIVAVGNILDAPPVLRGHHIGVDTPAAAAKATRDLLGLGVNAVKVYTKMTPELVRAVADAAHAAQKRVIGHITFSARDAALAGLDALEHGSGIALAVASDEAKVRAIPEHAGVFGWRFMDVAKADALARLLVDEQVVVVPALANWARGATAHRPRFQADAERLLADSELAYVPADVRERVKTYATGKRTPEEMRELEADYRALNDFLGRFRRAGGTLVVGTDNGILNGLGTHHELELLVAAGLSPVDAIRAATADAAALIQAGDLGVVAAGKAADLVIVTGDPSRSIADTRRIERVIKRGQLVDTRFHRDYRIPIPRPPVEGSRP
jgi:imidazolonepropionase-like amidohydrolase